MVEDSNIKTKISPFAVKPGEIKELMKAILLIFILK